MHSPAARLRSPGFTRLEFVAVLVIIAFGVIPSSLNWKCGGNEGGVRGALWRVVQANEQYLKRHGVFADSLETLGEAELIHSVLASGRYSGYVMVCQLLHGGWTCAANPEEPGVTADTYYFIDGSGVLRFHKDRPAGVDDEEYVRKR